MKVLIVTNMLPFRGMDYFGNFVLSEANEIAKSVEKLDILFVNGRKSKINYLIGVIKYLCITHKYDVVHFHHTYVATYGLLKKPKKMILTMHEGGNFFREGADLRIDYRHGRSGSLEAILKALSIREKILSISDRLILAYSSDEEIKWRNKTVHCIPPGVDPNRFCGLTREKARAVLNISNDANILLFPHEPRSEKNIELFNYLVSAVREAGFDITVIIGGKIPYSKMPLYLAACDCFYILSKFESSPMVAKEGIFAGANLISFDVGDIKNNFSQNPNCVIVSNIGEAIESTLKILKSTPKNGIPSKNNLSHLTVQNTARRVFALYE